MSFLAVVIPIRSLTNHDGCNICNSFQEHFVFPDLVQIHLDGKIRKVWGKKNDYLALCVTGKGLSKEKILGDVPIGKGTGRNMATACFLLLVQWALASRALAIGFDTTGSMTGPDIGKWEGVGGG